MSRGAERAETEQKQEQEQLANSETGITPEMGNLLIYTGIPPQRVLPPTVKRE